MSILNLSSFFFVVVDIFIIVLLQYSLILFFCVYRGFCAVSESGKRKKLFEVNNHGNGQ